MKTFIFIIMINSKIIHNNFDCLYDKILKMYSIINSSIIINEFIKISKINKY